MVPKINVYLPDELAAAVRDAGVPVSSVCQAALERAVREVTALREGPRTGSDEEAAWASSTRVAFGRYTPRARRAVELASGLARSRHHDRVGTEHLLLGILDEGGNLAIKVLQSLDVERGDLRDEVLGHVKDGRSAEAPPPFSPRLRTALEKAVVEAAKLGHNYIGCEHLLLGLIAEPEGLGGSVLRQFGLELRVVRRAVVGAVAGYTHATTQPAHQDEPLAEIRRRLESIEQRLGL